VGLDIGKTFSVSFQTTTKGIREKNSLSLPSYICPHWKLSLRRKATNKYLFLRINHPQGANT
jgi:hypothetical protein